MVVVNRTPAKAQSIVAAMQGYFPECQMVSEPWSAAVIDQLMPDIDLFINTTSIGLNGEDFPSLPFARAKSTAIASDIIYSPQVTPFLRQAQACGLRCQNGLAMFVHQGAQSFALWTGRTPPLEVMETAVLQALAYP